MGFHLDCFIHDCHASKLLAIDQHVTTWAAVTVLCVIFGGGVVVVYSASVMALCNAVCLLCICLYVCNYALALILFLPPFRVCVCTA